jgi:hypothetical protein
MSKKPNWAEIDKRIRGRRPSWTKEERGQLESELNKLPDLSDKFDFVEVAQPALAPKGVAEPADEPN